MQFTISTLHPIRDLTVYIFMIYFNIIFLPTPVSFAFLFKFSKAKYYKLCIYNFTHA
jgi:hypothetical protein